MERGDVKLRIKRASDAPAMNFVAPIAMHPAPAHAPAPSAHPVHAPASGASAAPAGGTEEDQDLFYVKSPIVGTFYEAPSPGSPPFVSIGDQVQVGQVLCI